MLRSRVGGEAAYGWQGPEPTCVTDVASVSKSSSPTPHGPAALLSVVLLTCSQPRSEHIQWDIPERSSNSHFRFELSCLSELWDKIVHHPSQDMNHLFV